MNTTVHNFVSLDAKQGNQIFLNGGGAPTYKYILNYGIRAYEYDFKKHFNLLHLGQLLKFFMTNITYSYNFSGCNAQIRHFVLRWP